MLNEKADHLKELPVIARKLVEQFAEERVFAFYGKMGAGKPSFQLNAKVRLQFSAMPIMPFGSIQESNLTAQTARRRSFREAASLYQSNCCSGKPETTGFAESESERPSKFRSQISPFAPSRASLLGKLSSKYRCTRLTIGASNVRTPSGTGKPRSSVTEA